ncbi:tungstate transport system ATP-binding protein [Paucimonas lemoignei]|uniref:Tungstate transport system ATP-binding protein n=1 Tax=Paucimonas lemoignei TaxID=29443 RepID=A0A4R3HS65_PAULE|nr:energy-coupling factor ABC transporter ATP-binding protein [Paucimonas lemoignei]TCS35986.1 tungstate transport system ATP-binding protein [Paucimonas lemoignei]
MNPLLSMYRLRKQFGQRQLFDIDALVVCTASAYALTGLNGSGKSTLLKILAGLEKADIGEACFHGHRIELHPYPQEMRNAIVYVHQHPVMFSTSVADNIGYGLARRGFCKRDIEHLVAEAIDWADIAHLLKSNPLTLSGGEKQRVALARAKVLKPELLLLDEPTASLDGAAREQVISLISDLTAAGGSVMMATHDRDLIRLRGVQRLKLQDGRLQARQNRIRVA